MDLLHLDAADDAYGRLDRRVIGYLKLEGWPDHYTEEIAHIEKHQGEMDEYLRRL